MKKGDKLICINTDVLKEELTLLRTYTFRKFLGRKTKLFRFIIVRDSEGKDIPATQERFMALPKKPRRANYL